MFSTIDMKSDSTNNKRVLHFSDGILEESDSDEDNTHSKDSNEVKSENQLLDKNWSKVSVIMNGFVWFGSQTLKVCDYLGQTFADFFGITSPKYESEIEEYKRRVDEHKRRQSMITQEFEGWNQNHSNNSIKFSDVKTINYRTIDKP